MMGEASNIDPLKFNMTDLNEGVWHTILELISDGIWDWWVSMSFGVVQRFDQEQQTGLMARADQALYRSKIAGKELISG